MNVKHVFVVDEDIDIFDDAQMDWALASRFQADRDLVVLDGHASAPRRSVHGELQGQRKGRFRSDDSLCRARRQRMGGAGASLI